VRTNYNSELAQRWQQKLLRNVKANMWKRKSTLSVMASTKQFFKPLLLRKREIKKSDRIRSCTYNTAYDDVF
jgi:hypothetical protein